MCVPHLERETHFIPSDSEKSSDDDYDESHTDHENDESDLELLVEVLEESDDELAINTSSFEAGHSVESRSMIKLLQFFSHFLLKFRAVYRISDNAMQVIIAFITVFLTGLAADIPASRKAGGFCRHNASKGCSRCLKTFMKKYGEKTDYSGFDVENWPEHCEKIHKDYGYKVLTASTKQERKDIAKEYRARYSVLFELPYYNCIRSVPIDPMHSLFLGTAKHIMNTWKSLELLDKTKFSIIQSRIKSCNVPSSIGRIPTKVEACIGSLTADEWKNWTCIYSPFALWDVLPSEHMECWLKFAHACRIICQPILQKDEISKIHELLIEFCKTCERLYGPEFCTMNLHLHCHMGECLYDFGPSHGFWCFAFERCNGILGSYPNNNRNIEKTMMTRFIEESSRSAHHESSDIVKLVNDLFIDGSRGSVSETQMNPEDF